MDKTQPFGRIAIVCICLSGASACVGLVPVAMGMIALGLGSFVVAIVRGE